MSIKQQSCVEAMKQALEALETCGEDEVGQGFNETVVKQAIPSLRQAIAEAEKQEPVMGVEVKRIASGGFIGNVWWIHENLQEGVFHLYTHPQPQREWVGLTDEQIHIRYKAMRGDKSPRYIEIYRDCENAHGIKGK